MLYFTSTLFSHDLALEAGGRIFFLSNHCSIPAPMASKSQARHDTEQARKKKDTLGHNGYESIVKKEVILIFFFCQNPFFSLSPPSVVHDPIVSQPPLAMGLCHMSIICLCGVSVFFLSCCS